MDETGKPQVRLRALIAVIRITLLVLSGWALKRELSALTLADLSRRVGSYGWSHVARGLAGVAASFLLLGALEILTLRARRCLARVRPHVAIATSFVAHALSQSVGVALLTGTAVRLRSYSRRGISAAEVARISTSVTLAVAVGLLGAGAWAFLAHAAPTDIGRYTLSPRPIGALLCLTIVLFLAWGAAGTRRAATPADWGIAPPPMLALGQVALSAADWLITGAVLYAFLPAGTGLDAAHFLQLYIIAQLAGMLSHVPAGAGVFEVVLLALLATAAPHADRGALVAAIVTYRLFYYLLPLASAVLLGGVTELRSIRRGALDAAPPRPVGDAQLARHVG